ncbi:hypothetical protein OZN62_07085 [Aurantiacibacter sp. MUD11]|uniref:hypothetical protein n=1 Tax=Aurantiacibacter sp. MUD11 TaxID=3003265 RepID=UPI0022AAF796|nr:hypothetical protein [Aurantiacibacter sp. MUD11]WAT16712.1 hypothetical protein OZN62_07085 [Aurantiacibacter sp. MUD11]
MNTKLVSAASSIALLSLGACTQSMLTDEPNAAAFGEPNRQTMAAQVVNPEPEYDTLVPASSAEHAADAVERYNEGNVKEPNHIPSTSPSGGS